MPLSRAFLPGGIEDKRQATQAPLMVGDLFKCENIAGKISDLEIFPRAGSSAR